MWDEEECTERLSHVDIDSELVNFSMEDWLENYESFEVYVPHGAIGVTSGGTFVLNAEALGYRTHQPFLHSARVVKESENSALVVTMHRNVTYMHGIDFAYFTNQIPLEYVELVGQKKLVQATVKMLTEPASA